MTHFDEGQLHAYLDGGRAGGERGTLAREIEAHLADCGECRARLEAERRVRDRAQAILGAAGPASLTAPPFEAVLDRAARRRASRSRIRPTVGLAWAASLALAITVGWYARGQMFRAGGAAEAAGAAGAGEAEVRTRGIEAGPPAPTQVAQGAPAREELAQAPRAEADVVPAPATPVVQDRPLANLAAAEAKAAADTEALPLRMAEAPAPSPPVIALRRSEPRVAAADLAEQSWITVAPGEAERRLGGPLALIPGLPSLGTSIYGAGASTVARTIQVLGPGLTIELVQQQATPAMAEGAARERAVAPAAMPQAGRGVGEEPGRSLTVQWEGYSVTGRALVPADSLRRLLTRLSRP